MAPDRTTIDTDVCILGAGPHGLAAAVALRRARPDVRLVVVDPSGEWLAGWHEHFARAAIASLRSPIVHHPAPEPSALTRHVEANGLMRSGLPYDPPTTDAFASFCTELIAETELDDPLAAAAETIVCAGNGAEVVAGHHVIAADHVIVATNPRRRAIPDWVWPLLGHHPGLVSHGNDVDLRNLADLDGRRVAVIGGGLTASHLTCGATATGAEVHLITRRPIESRNFDTDPGWLGPKFLHAFDQIADPARRLQAALEARGGGTIPPWMRNRLHHLEENRSLVLHEGCEVRAASPNPESSTAVLALDDHTTVDADQVWLAIGAVPDIAAQRCLNDITADVPVIDGFPVTDEALRLGPHPVHVMGPLATITLGPAAGNLWGAQRAAARIAAAITGVDLDRTPTATPPPPAMDHH